MEVVDSAITHRFLKGHYGDFGLVMTYDTMIMMMILTADRLDECYFPVTTASLGVGPSELRFLNGFI